MKKETSQLLNSKTTSLNWTKGSSGELIQNEYHDIFDDTKNSMFSIILSADKENNSIYLQVRCILENLFWSQSILFLLIKKKHIHIEEYFKVHDWHGRYAHKELFWWSVCILIESFGLLGLVSQKKMFYKIPIIFIEFLAFDLIKDRIRLAIVMHSWHLAWREHRIWTNWNQTKTAFWVYSISFAVKKWTQDYK